MRSQMSILFYLAHHLHKLFYIQHLHLFDEPTVVSARLYHHHLCRSLYRVEVDAVSAVKKLRNGMDVQIIGMITQKRLMLEVKLLLSANTTQQRITFSDLEWPHRALSLRQLSFFVLTPGDSDANQARIATLTQVSLLRHIRQPKNFCEQLQLFDSPPPLSLPVMLLHFEMRCMVCHGDFVQGRPPPKAKVESRDGFWLSQKPSRFLAQ